MAHAATDDPTIPSSEASFIKTITASAEAHRQAINNNYVSRGRWSKIASVIKQRVAVTIGLQSILYQCEEESESASAKRAISYAKALYVSEGLEVEFTEIEYMVAGLMSFSGEELMEKFDELEKAFDDEHKRVCGTRDMSGKRESEADSTR